MVNFGTKAFDKVAGIRCAVTANGPIDAAPSWSFTATATDTDGNQQDVPGCTLTPAADGLSADFLVPETQIDAVTITCVAPVDDPNTEGVETISEVFSGSFSHSKASTLTGAVTDIPR